MDENMGKEGEIAKNEVEEEKIKDNADNKLGIWKRCHGVGKHKVPDVDFDTQTQNMIDIHRKTLKNIDITQETQKNY